MRVIRYLTLFLARRFQAAGSLFSRTSDLFNGLLPALFSPPELTRLLQKHYARLYSDGFVKEAYDLIDYLERWETEVLDRYKITSGRMLVLGSGLGRESIAIARNGVSVVGVETDPAAVRIAQQMARTLGVPSRYLHADFLQLPNRSGCFDFVLLSQRMYSAIPSRSQRLTLLADLRRVLKPNGMVILSFFRERTEIPRVKTICRRLNAILAGLPGANMAYQFGDECEAEHFLHRFQDEEEIRRELSGAGVFIQELDWVRGFAVLTFAQNEIG
jgi:SAM-dependent methyltransferase